MDINKKLGWHLLTYTGIALLFVGCAEFEKREISVDKPQSIVDQEALDAYDELKSYVDYSSQPAFKLGVELGLADVSNNGVLYRLMQRHFDEISFASSVRHIDFVGPDGSIALGAFQAALDRNDSIGMPVYAGHLVSHEQQQADYLNGLIADIYIPGEAGSTVVVDFENDDFGTSYPVFGEGSGVIIDDPDGESGKTLNMLGPQTFPQFQITLPEGLTLANCQSVSIDFKGGGCCGLYGAGMRLAVSEKFGPVDLTSYDSPSSFGVADGQWTRSAIILPFANLNLTDEQKELTSFVLTIGSATGSADYLMDNVTIQWEETGETIIKTPEEKTNIITAELDKWIKGVGEVGKDRVQAWGVVYQPMDDANPTELRSGHTTDTPPANTFFWQDYLGKDYAATAIGMIKQYANADAQIFFTETGLDNNPAKIQGLMDFITYTEGKGVTVDGIATELALDITADKAKIETMLQNLATTGKLIKIAGLDIGTGGTTGQATPELYQQQAEMYKWFVEAYMNHIPADQRAGITFRSPTDRSGSAGWRPNEPVGLWTNANGYQRKPAYRGVLEALQRQ